MYRASLFAVVVVAAFFAYINGVQLAFTLVYAAILVTALSVLWSLLTSRRVSFLRQAPGGTQMVGEVFAQRFTIENDSFLPIPMLEVRDLAGFPGYRASRGISLRAHERVTWESEVRLLARGRYSLGPTEVRLADPFGLFPRRVRFEAQGSVLVYPAIYNLPDLAFIGARAGLDSDRGGRPRDLPPSASGIREHDPADGIGRIHWISTARKGRLMSRTFDAEEGSDLLVVLDLRRGVHRGTAPESSLEYAVTMAASVAHGALRHGRAVGLLATDRVLTDLAPLRGDAQEQLIMETLALAQADGQIGLGEVLSRHLPTWRNRGNVVLVTSDPSGEWVEAMAANSQPGRRAVAIYVDPQSFGREPKIGRIPTQWRLVLDIWQIRQGDDLSRLEPVVGRAVV
ncbi:MAG: DUF58 domain-containing protein [Candidatus Dormibacteraeota bacterium]|jgi:uncharacterized protein (DUF58 family)|nr:DUF58 domain-containing protein [Candidatus Dormibacteraeota bacterium]